MSEWLNGLAGYFLITSIIMQMIPKGKYEPYIRLFTGFLLILLILQPVLKIRDADGFLERQIEKFVEEQESVEQNIKLQSQIFQEKSNGLENYEMQSIEVDKVQQITVEVTMDD